MKNRILTAIAGIPLVLALIFWSGAWPLGIFLVLVCALAWSEAANFVQRKLPLLIAALGALATVGILFTPYQPTGFKPDVLIGSLFSVHVLSTIVTGVSLKRNIIPLYLVSSLIYVGLPLCGLLWLHQLNFQSNVGSNWNFLNPILLLVLPIWAGDTAAIFVGKLVGRHKLAPSISPQKTIEGSIGNLLAAIATAWGVGTLLQTPLPECLAIGAACGILGQAGDLFESWMKRIAGVKDSGALLPGHGGILDRIDSILFCVLPVLLILLFGTSK